MSTTKMNDPEDIFLWPDGSWCFREESSAYKSDGYEVLEVDSPDWIKIVTSNV